MTVQLLSANHAAGAAAILAATANRTGRGFGSGVYPITPQTECIEYLCDETIEKGSVVRVESEHSAMAVCMGFAAGGCRTFTASSSNGLAYMAENVFAAGFARLPIVMMAVNRTLGPPWNIWCDHGDTLMLRDSGWLQLYCEDNQEVADTILAAYRLAEDPRVLLPAMVCQDAFILSHTLMQTDLPSQEQVDAFLPTLKLPHRLGEKPRTIGAMDAPHETEAHRAQCQQAFDRVPGVYAEVQKEFEKAFGRKLADVVVPYKADDAEVLLVSMGTIASTARRVVDAAREKGLKVGSLRVRMFRPFPVEALARVFQGKKRIAILDRNLCPGLGGILWGEARALAPKDALVQDYIVGIGGGDVRPAHVQKILDDVLARTESGQPQMVEVGS
jgi:pyruvate/2-oxoacid:ferredoxin oxidoreductase alpha subunit